MRNHFTLHQKNFMTYLFCISILIILFDSVFIITPFYSNNLFSPSFSNVPSFKTEIIEKKLSSNYNPLIHDSIHLSMDDVVMNITKANGFFEGYNLFVLEERNKYDHSNRSYTVLITSMDGKIVNKLEVGEKINLAKILNSTTVLVGKPYENIFWNIDTNVTSIYKYIDSYYHHHEIEYNPFTETFLTFIQHSIDINGSSYLFDMILEYNVKGHIIWALDTHSFISHTQWCPYQDMMSDKRDLTHSNTLFWDFEEDIIYYNSRNVNTFYKINHTSSEIIWSLGEYGNFTLFNKNGIEKECLFYHAHAIEKISDNLFIIFDNDAHNQTDSNNKRSRMLEITINESTMTANESWSWVAPSDYYSAWWGDADRLPNGNRLGTFGTVTHPDTNLGARLVEVNEEGSIVWEMNFPPNPPFIYGVYRMERFSFSPILSSPDDVVIYPSSNSTISWNAWYNFRTKCSVNGLYTLFLDGNLIVSGEHAFEKFWSASELTFDIRETIGTLPYGTYNLTLALEDEAGHITSDSLNLTVSSFFISREGPMTIETGQPGSIVSWEGITSAPLTCNIYVNETLISDFEWGGEAINLDLNSLSTGKSNVSLILLNESLVEHVDSFWVTIYPTEVPQISSFPLDETIVWNDSLTLTWDIFDNSPSSWAILVNGSVYQNDDWVAPSYYLSWLLPKFNEKVYNITLVITDLLGLESSVSTIITIISPSFPIIASTPSQTVFQWGQEDVSLIWEVHGGTSWFFWKNSTLLHSGTVLDPVVEIIIQEWQAENWRLGVYNLTLQVVNAFGTAIESEVWITIFLDFGDLYADEAISSSSLWSSDIEKAEGAPDGEFAIIYVDYGNGYITLDMGENEEILDGDGYDFTIYSMDGSYSLWISNDLSKPFTILGFGQGNQSFDLSLIGVNEARYIRVEYRSGDFVSLDAVEALNFNYLESDSKQPEIIKKPDNITTLFVEYDQILLFWEVFDITPWNYTIYTNNIVSEVGIWDGADIEFAFIVTTIGTFEIKLILYDLYGNKAEDNVIIIIEEESTSSTTYTTYETNSANWFFFTSFLVLPVICRNRYRKYMIKNNKEYKSH